MAPIGIFDSGVGGLSVLAEFRKLAPGHPVVYLADQAWAPYGERSLSEVRQRSVAIARYLIGEGCPIVVVACNSASAAALRHLRGEFPGARFVGMEPAVKPAANMTERGVIGVLATDATFQGELYASVVDRHAGGTEVVEQACPGLADSVECLGVDAPETVALLAEYLTPLRRAGIDTLVLGCTHYPFLIPEINRLLGDGINLVDPAPAVARQAVRLLGDPDTGAGTEFLTTGDPQRFESQIDRLLGRAERARFIEIEHTPGHTVVAVQGDITRMEVDAIVNAANDMLRHGGGVAAAISRAGGPVVQAESDEWIRCNGRLPGGRAAITSAGDMPARHVIHVAGPRYRTGQDNEGMLRAAVVGALNAAKELGARSIAIPAISAGIYGYPLGDATSIVADEVIDWLDGHPGVLDEVRLVGYDTAATERFEAGIATARSHR